MTSEKKTWFPTPKDAVAQQRLLAGSVLCETPEKFAPRTIAGVDVSCSRFSHVLYAGVVVLDVKDGTILDSASIIRDATFPYIPGLLSFREAPAIFQAWQSLNMKPDLVIVDGNGIAHPRHFGLAAHLGVLWDLPTIGCAKSRLLGRHREPGMTRGSACQLLHHGKVIGSVVRTKAKVAPVYVSVGHRITLEDAKRWILRTCNSYRLPLPIRRAHEYVNQVRRDAKKP